MEPTQDQVSCSICLDAIDKDKNTTTTDCGHTFHANCLLKASQQSSTCPLCRTKLFDKTIEIHNSLNARRGEIAEMIIVEFINSFPNDAIMNEIHNIYHERFSDSEVPEARNMSEQTITQMATLLHQRVGGYLHFAYNYIMNNE